MTNQLTKSNAIIEFVMEWKKCVFSLKVQQKVMPLSNYDGIECQA